MSSSENFPIISPRSPRGKQVSPRSEDANNCLTIEAPIPGAQRSRENSMRGTTPLHLPPISPPISVSGSRRASLSEHEALAALVQTTTALVQQPEASPAQQSASVTSIIAAALGTESSDAAAVEELVLSTCPQVDSDLTALAPSAPPAPMTLSLPKSPPTEAIHGSQQQQAAAPSSGASTHRSSRIESGANIDFSYMNAAAISATALRDGTFVVLDERFAQLCESTVLGLTNKNIVDIAAFDSPDEMMLATCTISELDKDDIWTCPLKNNSKYAITVSVTTASPPNLAPKSKSKRIKQFLKVTLTPNVTYTFPRRENNLSNALGGGLFSARLPSERVTSSSLKVLVVDDSITVTNIIAHQLKAEGYKVVVENNGQSALERLTLSPPNEFYVALVDINMPLMGGLQVCHEFRAVEQARALASDVVIGLHHHQLLIGLTGDFSATIVHEVMAAGFDGFLPKPFSVKKFKEVVEDLTLAL